MLVGFNYHGRGFVSPVGGLGISRVLVVAVNLVLAWRVTDVGVERQVDAVSRGGHGQPLDSRVFLRHMQDVGFHVSWHVDRPVAALPLAVAGVLGPGEVGGKQPWPD